MLAGTWKLTSTSGSLDNMIRFVSNDTAVTLTGSQTFSGNSTSSDSLFVHAVITQNNKKYFNNILHLDTTIVSGLDQSTSDAQSIFEMIGRDSIHFEGLGIPLTAGLIYIGGAEGLKYNITGNTLTLTSYIFNNDSSAASVQRRTRTIVNIFTRK